MKWDKYTIETTTEAEDYISCTPVSYTHLRAHETDSYLVCRLLLEKKINASLYTEIVICQPLPKLKLSE